MKSFEEWTQSMAQPAEEPHLCDACHGQGFEMKVGMDNNVIEETCSMCDGYGKVIPSNVRFDGKDLIVDCRHCGDSCIIEDPTWVVGSTEEYEHYCGKDQYCCP